MNLLQKASVAILLLLSFSVVLANDGMSTTSGNTLTPPVSTDSHDFTVGMNDKEKADSAATPSSQTNNQNENKMAKIDFNKMEETSFPNFKGGEKSYEAKMFFDGKNRIMKGRLTPGSSIGIHTHDTSSEIMYFLEGVATAIYDGVELQMLPGECHYCEKGHTHSLINKGTEDVVFFAVVPEQ